jgi:hypothetical protein
LWLGPIHPLFCAGGVCGFLQGDGPYAQLGLSTVGIGGILGQHPLKVIADTSAHPKGAAGIATEQGVLVAAVTEKALVVVSVNARGETSELDRIATPARSAVWTSGGEAPHLVWSDPDGVFAVRFADGKRAKNPLKLPVQGDVSAAGFRGKQLWAISGSQLVSTRAVTALTAPNIEILSTFIAEGYAWFVWHKRQGLPLSLTQVPLK